MIQTGDCLEVMAGMPAESVDAVVTDPPYALEFMGKSWDRFGRGEAQSDAAAMFSEDGMGKGFRALPSYLGGLNPRCKVCGRSQRGGSQCVCERPQFTNEVLPRVLAFQAWCTEWGREALRVTKPGGYLLAFGGTRTHHRLVCGLEDAGWIIRDELDWIYASGFPKGKANLKPAHEPIVLARKPGPLRPLGIDATRIAAPENVGRVWTRGGKQEGASLRTNTSGENEYVEAHPAGRWPSNLLLSDPALFDEPNPEVVGSGATSVGGAFPQGLVSYDVGESWGKGMKGKTNPERTDLDGGGYSRFFLIPKADRGDREPVLRDAALLLHRERGECDKLDPWENEARRPDEQTDSTSTARAISVSKPGTDSNSDTSSPGKLPTDPFQSDTRSTTSTATSRTTDSITSSSLTPSPISASTLAANSETGNGGSPAGSAESSSLWGSSIGTSPLKDGRTTGAADRATSARSSRRNSCAECGKPLPRVGVHPTTKPTDLMRHLIRLVTPSGGRILDPFGGSGTTAVAAELEGFDWILIEQDASYVAIAEARLNGTQRGLGLDVDAPTQKKSKAKSHWPARRTPHKSEGWGFTSGQEELEERYEGEVPA